MTVTCGLTAKIRTLVNRTWDYFTLPYYMNININKYPLELGVKTGTYKVIIFELAKARLLTLIYQFTGQKGDNVIMLYIVSNSENVALKTYRVIVWTEIL